MFQRRQDGSVDFYRDWSDYENGFGNVSSEHWLGNEKISRITSRDEFELRIDLADSDGKKRYAKYNNFRLGNVESNYVNTWDLRWQCRQVTFKKNRSEWRLTILVISLITWMDDMI